MIINCEKVGLTHVMDNGRCTACGHMPAGLKRGIYETCYGSIAYVNGPKTKTAFDLAFRLRINITEVLPIFVRAAERGDVR